MALVDKVKKILISEVCIFNRHNETRDVFKYLIDDDNNIYEYQVAWGFNEMQDNQLLIDIEPKKMSIQEYHLELESKIKMKSKNIEKSLYLIEKKNWLSEVLFEHLKKVEIVEPVKRVAKGKYGNCWSNDEFSHFFAYRIK